MARKGAKPFKEHGTVAVNRRARHDYAIEEEIEVGLQLTGSEVKSLRQGKCSIAEAHAGEMKGELYLFNAHISEYPPAMFNHEPRRPRKLLVHNRELKRLIGRTKEQGYTLVPMELYFNGRGIAKLRLGLGKGKKKIDKRETEKKRDWERRKAQLLREHK